MLLRNELRRLIRTNTYLTLKLLRNRLKLWNRNWNLTYVQFISFNYEFIFVHCYYDFIMSFAQIPWINFIDNLPTAKWGNGKFLRSLSSHRTQWSELEVNANFNLMMLGIFVISKWIIFLSPSVQSNFANDKMGNIFPANFVAYYFPFDELTNLNFWIVIFKKCHIVNVSQTMDECLTNCKNGS